MTKLANTAKYRDVREGGVLDGGTALVCGKTRQMRESCNGARMGLIGMPSARFIRVAQVEWAAKDLVERNVG